MSRRLTFRRSVMSVVAAAAIAVATVAVPAVAASPASYVAGSLSHQVGSTTLQAPNGKLTAKKPKIVGEAVVGKTLTAKQGKWTSGTKFFYQWYLAGKPVKGKNGTKKNLKVTSAMVGKKLRVEVTGAKPGFKMVTKKSKMTTQVAKAKKSSHKKMQVGLVWASQVDSKRINQPARKQPTFKDSGGVTARIEMILRVNSKLSGDLAEQCAIAIVYFGKAGDTECLFVQWSFDVPANYKADEAALSPGPLLTRAGRQITQATTATGVPGAKGVFISAMYAGGTPGSTLRWDTGSNKLGWETVIFKVPAAKNFIPLNFT